MSGLDGSFIDATQGLAEVQQSTDTLDIREEIDRIYRRSGEIIANDLRIKVTDGDSVVVWSPGLELSASMADLGESADFLCIEAASLEKVDLTKGQQVRTAFEVYV